MIRYDLRCGGGCAFDGWFRDSAGFEAERAAARVCCPFCGRTDVEKALMAPSVAARNRAAAEPPEPGPAGGSERAPSLSAAPDHPLHRALGELRRKLETEADYVGRRFAEEARSIHRGEAEARAIWGEATPEEARALKEEGAPVAPLPPLPRRDD